MDHCQRAVQITFPKCGSQWIRDVLTAPEIVVHSRMPLAPPHYRNRYDLWPEQQPQTFMGPLYSVSLEHWEKRRRSGDKALIVLRDPRDLAVSMVHSLCFSHGHAPMVTACRRFLLALQPRDRIIWSITDMSSMASQMVSWAGLPSTSTEYLTTYERVLASPMEEFARIAAFFGWEVPESLLAGVVHRLSFAERSGRAAGQEDVFSHYRRGEAGDWRRHFDRELGQMWEAVWPGLLALMGYEQDNRWCEGLPEKLGTYDQTREVTAQMSLIDLQRDLVKLREENGELRKGIAAFQAHVQAMEERMKG